jgi:hypothetical protein
MWVRDKRAEIHLDSGEINGVRKERWRGRGVIWALRGVHVEVTKTKVGGCKVN